MRRLIVGGWLAALLAMPPLLGADEKEGSQKDGSQKSEKPAAKDPKNQTTAFGNLTGKIVNVDSEGKQFTLRVYAKVPQVNMSRPFAGCSA